MRLVTALLKLEPRPSNSRSGLHAPGPLLLTFQVDWSLVLNISFMSESLAIQITQIDYTLVAPGPLDNATLPLVPVLRIFGPSSTGDKACLHVHQVYPYFYVNYLGSLTPESGMYISVM